MHLKTRWVHLAILVLLEVSTTVASADELRITPAGLKFSKVGESQQIICAIFTQNPNISMLLIQRYHPVGSWTGLPTEIVSSNTKSYTISNLSFEDRGKYRCAYNETYRIMQLFVDYPPLISQDVNCSAVDSIMMICSWSLKDNENDISSNWTVRATDGFSAINLCPKQEFSDTRLTCTWNDIMSYSVFTIYVDGFNRVGTTNRIFVVNTTRIVMLSKFSIRTDAGSHNVTLHWDLTEAFFTSCTGSLCNITYTLVYKAVDGGENRTLKIMSLNSTVEYTIQNLTPFTTYEISVSGRPQASVLWSDNSTVKVSTKKAVPAAPPVTDERLYYTDISSRKERIIFLYLKPILASEMYSDSFGYNFKLYQVSVSKETLKWTYNATYLNGTFELPFSLRNDSSYRISVCSYNDVGFSTESTDITIPAITTVSFLPRSVIVDGNCKDCSSGVYRLTWNMDKNQMTDVLKFTVMWCRGEDVPICKGDLNWSVHSSNESFALVDVGDQGNSHWMFAVSASNHAGYSGGIQFAVKSIYGKDIPISDGGLSTWEILIFAVGGVIVLITIIVTILYIRSRYKNIQIDITLPTMKQRTGVIDLQRNNAFSLENDKNDDLGNNSVGSSDSGVSSDCSVVSDVNLETEENAPAEDPLNGNSNIQNGGNLCSCYSPNGNCYSEGDQCISSSCSLRDKLSVEINTNLKSNHSLNRKYKAAAGDTNVSSKSTHSLSPGKECHFHVFFVEDTTLQHDSTLDKMKFSQKTSNRINNSDVLHNDSKFSDYVTADASFSDLIQFSKSSENHLTESGSMLMSNQSVSSCFGDYNDCISLSVNPTGYHDICFTDDRSGLTDSYWCNS